MSLLHPSSDHTAHKNAKRRRECSAKRRNDQCYRVHKRHSASEVCTRPDRPWSRFRPRAPFLGFVTPSSRQWKYVAAATCGRERGRGSWRAARGSRCRVWSADCPLSGGIVMRRVLPLIMGVLLAVTGCSSAMTAASPLPSPATKALDGQDTPTAAASA